MGEIFSTDQWHGNANQIITPTRKLGYPSCVCDCVKPRTTRNQKCGIKAGYLIILEALHHLKETAIRVVVWSGKTTQVVVFLRRTASLSKNIRIFVKSIQQQEIIRKCSVHYIGSNTTIILTAQQLYDIRILDGYVSGQTEPIPPDAQDTNTWIWYEKREELTIEHTLINKLHQHEMRLYSMRCSTHLQTTKDKTKMDWDYFERFEAYTVGPVYKYTLDQTFNYLAAKSTVVADPTIAFSNYLARLATFQHFDGKHSPSLIKLAKAGYYATGNGDETACFHCGARHSSWYPNDDPITLHRLMNSDCEFIQELNMDNTGKQTTASTVNSVPGSLRLKSDAVTLVRKQTTASTVNCVPGSLRLKSETVNSVTSDYFSGESEFDEFQKESNNTQTNTIKHSSNDTETHGPIQSESAEGQYSSYSINQPSGELQNLSLDNKPSYPSDPSMEDIPGMTLESTELYTPDKTDNRHASTKTITTQGKRNTSSMHSTKRRHPALRQDLTRPCHPIYQPIPVRMSSFARCPNGVFQSTRDMALAGFFYKGYGDAVECFWCGLSTVNWKRDDDPAIEHAKLQPLCPYLIEARGQGFVDFIQEDLQNTKTVIQEASARNTADKASVDISGYEQVHQMGFDVEAILRAVTELSKLKVKYTPTEAEVADYLLNIQSKDDCGENSVSPVLSETIEEKEHAKRVELLTCKICMVDEVGVTFLPCGHLVSCRSCSALLRICPICREAINHRVISYLS